MADRLPNLPPRKETQRSIYVIVDLKNRSCRMTIPKPFVKALNITPQDVLKVTLLDNGIRAEKAD